MQREPSALHAAQPCHLALGKLMYRPLQPLKHLLIAERAREVQGHELILQSIIYQVSSRYAGIEQMFDLIEHSCLKTALQARCDLGAACLTRNVEGHDKGIDGLYGRAVGQDSLFGMPEIIFLNLDCAYGSLTSVDIGDIVQCLVASQDCGELIKGAVGERFAQLTVFRHLRHAHTTQSILQIHPATSTYHRHAPSAGNSGIGLAEVTQILIKIIFAAGRSHINQMIGHRPIFLKVLAGTEVHAGIHLARIGAQYFTVKGHGNSHGP